MIEGVRMKETWSRGYSNYIDMNGSSQIYTIAMMENGDKILTKLSLRQGEPAPSTPGESPKRF